MIRQAPNGSLAPARLYDHWRQGSTSTRSTPFGIRQPCAAVLANQHGRDCDCLKSAMTSPIYFTITLAGLALNYKRAGAPTKQLTHMHLDGLLSHITFQAIRSTLDTIAGLTARLSRMGESRAFYLCH